ncbi:MAG: hypothetical protein GF315_07345 [candidate division Zixibacteria bacterium]|nr:hypothetical protein [candidate division Zixibacteria bacterium]
MEPNEIRKADTATLRKFGLVMAIPLAIIGAVLLWKENGAAMHLFILAGLFAVLGLLLPRLLKPVYIVWMTFAFYMGMVMTYVLLTLFFFIALTPVSLVMQLIGKDLLKRKFPGNEDSYWVPAEEYPDDIERYSKPY